MKFAKSMYLGGVLIGAEEADFNTCKELGVICPLCSEAVFLRSGSTRKQTLRNGKVIEQIIDPYFAHYKSAALMPQDCDNRILTKKGKQELQNFKIEARNQRLKLYNKHLWEMFKTANGLTRKEILRNKKLLGQRFLENLATQVREQWGGAAKLLYNCIVEKVDLMKQMSESDFSEARTYHPSLTREEYESQSNYFKYQCDHRMHLLICQELVTFLATKTSSHFWLNLIASQVGLPKHREQWKTKEEILQNYSASIVIGYSVALIATTHWIEAINQQLGFVKS